MHIYGVQQQSFPKYPEVHTCTSQTWLLDSVRASDPLFLPYAPIQMCNTEAQIFIQTNLSSFQRGHDFSSPGAGGELAEPGHAAPSVTAGTSKRPWG